MGTLDSWLHAIRALTIQILLSFSFYSLQTACPCKDMLLSGNQLSGTERKRQAESCAQGCSLLPALLKQTNPELIISAKRELSVLH